jgi:uncharacterized phage protein (TIGR01671 family)
MNNLNKFRVWCVNYKEWEKDQILIDKNGWIYHYGKSGLRIVSPESHIIQWFTGLYDKNGKEIYEGDLIKEWYPPEETGGEYGKESVVVVCFGEYNASSMFGGNECYIGFYLNDSNPDYQADFFMNLTTWEVVGNIFENPELLK